MSSNELATVFGSTEATLPAHLEASGDKGLGNENVGVEDFAIPNIKLLQPLSPEVDDEENDGLKPGVFFNTATKETYDNLIVINLLYDHEYTIFKNRDMGGGHFGNYTSEAAAEAAIADLPGNREHYEITETARHTVMMMENDNGNAKIVGMARMNLSKSALQASREWNTLIATKSGDQPRFSRAWLVSPFKRSNSKGKWFGYKMDDLGWISEAMYAEAKKAYESLAKEGGES